MTNRVFPGGYYKMDHESFGRMMVSEQVRRPLEAVAKLVAARAKTNTVESSGEGPLAEGYEIQRGPLVTLLVGGRPSPRISHRVVNRVRYAAAREFGKGGHAAGRGTRDLRRAGGAFGDMSGGA